PTNGIFPTNDRGCRRSASRARPKSCQRLHSNRNVKAVELVSPIVRQTTEDAGDPPREVNFVRHKHQLDSRRYPLFAVRATGIRISLLSNEQLLRRSDKHIRHFAEVFICTLEHVLGLIPGEDMVLARIPSPSKRAEQIEKSVEVPPEP